ncbi:MAG: hypothetical protein ACRYGR_01035, partial [Janthinobacterium lividum]
QALCKSLENIRSVKALDGLLPGSTATSNEHDVKAEGSSTISSMKNRLRYSGLSLYLRVPSLDNDSQVIEVAAINCRLRP